MSKCAKIWLVIAASLVLVGVAVLGGIMTVLKWDFSKLSTNKYETNEYEISQEFKSIFVDTDTSDVVFAVSESNEYSVVCYEQKNIKHLVEVKDDTLVIKLVDARKWYEYIGINFDSPRIRVNIPSGEYEGLSVKLSTGDLEVPKELSFKTIDIRSSTGDITSAASASDAIKVKTTTGSITLEGASAGSLDLSVTTGKVTVSDVMCEGDVIVCTSTGKAHLSNIKCKNLTSIGDTGDITLREVIATGKFSIERDTGDVRFERCDASEIFAFTDTGDVEGSLLTDKVFITKSDTGDVRVPSSISGGRCEITTDTGDIEFVIVS